MAALERLLSLSDRNKVELRAYFVALCESIAASMIGDPQHIRLAVTGTGGVVDARVSISLGLIVTELVINALKHAFPDGRGGSITVDSTFRGPNWTLSARDDGVGMPRDPCEVRKGLGTSIVEALARQLGAVVETTSADPGANVTITHTQVALVDDGEHSTPQNATTADPAAIARGSR